MKIKLQFAWKHVWIDLRLVVLDMVVSTSRKWVHKAKTTTPRQQKKKKRERW